jgi:hypothetical protein
MGIAPKIFWGSIIGRSSSIRRSVR